MRRLPVQQKIVVGFVVALAILFGVGLVGYRSIVRLGQAEQQVQHAGEVLLNCESLMSSLQDVEMGPRGYLLTGEEKFLEPYREGVKEVDNTLRRLRQLTAGNAQEQKQLAALEGVIDRELAFAKRIIDRRKEGVRPLALGAAASRGKALLDRLRASLTELENTERGQLRERQEKVHRNSRFAQEVIVAGSLLALAFVSVALWIIRRDIASRRLVEESLADTNAKLEAVLSASTPVALIATDMHGAITFFNAGADRMLGYTPDEAVRKMSAMDFFVDAEVVAEAKTMFEKSGHLLNGLDLIVESARRGEVVERERTFVCKDGTQLTGSTTVTAMRDEHGGLIGFMIVAKDITEIKRSEQLLRAINDELNAFTYTVSHDLKAPLRGISGYAQELDRHHSEGLSERARFCISQILVAIRNLDRLIDDLLLYSRLNAESPKLTEVNVLKLIDGILKERGPVIAERGVEIEVEIPFAVVHTWERGLAQVLTNLIDNALKYSRNSSPPRLRFHGEEREDAYRIGISDNGIGFDMTYHNRIFGLFNRLVRAEDFEGTGAGLAIAKKLLDKLQGRIWAESTPGGGSTFFIELPRRMDTEMDT